MKNDAKKDDANREKKRDTRFTDDFAGKNGPTGNGGDEHFLSKVVFAINNQRNDTGGGRLKKCLGHDTKKREQKEVIAELTGKIGLETGTQNTNENKGEHETENNAKTVAK